MLPRINLPPLTRAILALLILMTCLNAAIRYRNWTFNPNASLRSRQFYAPYLTLVPGVSIIYPWTILTSMLVEQDVFGFLMSGLTIFYGGRYLERAWGSSEFAKFMVLLALVPNLFCFLIYACAFAINRNTNILSTSISGGIAVQVAFLVSFKQLVPEHTVTVAKGIISVRVKHFPAIFLFANTVSGFALGTDTATLLSWLGFIVSWTYLRFYRLSPSLTSASTGEDCTMRGDASDTFAFAYFFPEPMPAFIAPVTAAIYDALVAIRLCTPFTSASIEAGNEEATVRGERGLPSLLNPEGARFSRTGQREEAERRRALALKALDQRLQISAQVIDPAPDSTGLELPPNRTESL